METLMVTLMVTLMATLMVVVYQRRAVIYPLQIHQLILHLKVFDSITVLLVMVGSVNIADSVQEKIPQDTRSVQQSEQTHNEEQVNASSEQPAVAKHKDATGKEIK